MILSGYEIFENVVELLLFFHVYGSSIHVQHIDTSGPMLKCIIFLCDSTWLNNSQGGNVPGHLQLASNISAGCFLG